MAGHPFSAAMVMLQVRTALRISIRMRIERAPVVVARHHDGSMLRGRLLMESLRVGAELAVPGLLVRRLGREDVSTSAVATQPKVWAFVDFEAPSDRAHELAPALAAALSPDDGWYANFEVGNELVVVFAGKMFRYAKGDRVAHGEAVAYALSAGTPKQQIDWGE